MKISNYAVLFILLLSFKASGQMYMLGGGANVPSKAGYTATAVVHNVILQYHTDDKYNAGYLFNFFGSDPCYEGDYDDTVFHLGIAVGTANEFLFGGSVDRLTFLVSAGASEGNMRMGARILYRFRM